MQSTTYPPIRPLQTSYGRGPPFPAMYAQPSVSPSHATAVGTFVPSSQSYSVVGPGSISAQSPASYNNSSPESSMRPMTTYSSPYSFPPFQSHMGPPTSYSNPIFPRTLTTSSMPGESLSTLEGPAGLQLPPIRTSPLGVGPIDPAISEPPYRQGVQRSPREEQPNRDEGTREPDPKRPRMDIRGILGPRDRD